MLFVETVYIVTGIALFGLGFCGALLRRSLLGRIIAINICGAGLFLILVTIAYRGPALPPDALPHAMVLTGIVVAVSATALALALGRRLSETPDD